MPYGIEAQRWGLKKESVRLTAETTPTVWYAVDPSSEIGKKTMLLDDKALRGARTEYPSFAGKQLVAGKVKFPLRAQNIGEFLVMMFGAPTSVQQGGTAAYKHTFAIPSSVQPTTYTIFVDRSLDVQKYNGVAGKTFKLSSKIDSYVEAEADLIGLDEASGSIGSPTYTESGMLVFNQVTAKLGGSTITNLKDWDFTIEAGTFPKFTQSQQQVAADVISAAKFKVSGNMGLFFEDETQRNNFIANTQTSLEFLIEGPANSAATGYKYTADFLFNNIHWTAYPFGNDQGLLFAKATFKGTYATSQIVPYLINQMSAY